MTARGVVTQARPATRAPGGPMRFEPQRPRRLVRRRLSSAPVVCDMFAGAGLLSYAFAAEGFQLGFAVERDAMAASTYRMHLGDHIAVGDVRRVTPLGRCDVLTAGPPCQGFSTLGLRRADDPRNHLSLEVVRWAEILQPAIVVVENVAAFIGTPHHAVLVERLERLGYQTTVQELDAADFGVPQWRRRSFTFASRGELPVVRPRSRAVVTVQEAWEGLPASPDGKHLHIAPTPTPLALQRMRLIPPGGDRRDVLRDAPDLAPASWRRLGSNVTDAWGRMFWDQPSNTLRTMLQNPSKGRYLHPEQHRVMTLREAARLHSIPDAWTFAGYREQITTQIGNSVPPLLGRAVARAVMRAL